MTEKPYIDELGYTVCKHAYNDELLGDSCCLLLDEERKEWYSLCHVYLGDECPYWNGDDD